MNGTGAAPSGLGGSVGGGGVTAGSAGSGGVAPGQGGAPGGGAASGGGGTVAAGGSVSGGSAGFSGSSASGGTDPLGGAGGADSGSGGQAVSGAGAGGEGQAGGGMTGGWHAPIVASVTDAMLETEYATWKSRHVQSCSNGSSAVLRDSGSVVSEGIAYGLLLAVGFDDRALFDGLLQYYDDHVDELGLMNWATGVCDPPGDNAAHAATDGDLDAAMALVQAGVRWPDGGYLERAEAMAGLILMHEVVDCDGRLTLKPGDVWGGCEDMSGETRINPSYFAPGYYRVFAARFAAQATEWQALLEGTYELYPVLQERMDGLVPDWSDYDGADWFGSDYWYDACRTPWRLAVDYAFSGDERARTALSSFSSWVDSNGGLPSAAQQQNSAFVGAFALSGAIEAPTFDSYVGAWLGASLDDTQYFQGTLRVLYLLVAAGRFPSTL